MTADQAYVKWIRIPILFDKVVIDKVNAQLYSCQSSYSILKNTNPQYKYILYKIHVKNDGTQCVGQTNFEKHSSLLLTGETFQNIKSIML